MRPHQPHWIILYFLLTIPLPTFAEETTWTEIPVQLTSSKQITKSFSRLPLTETTHFILTNDYYAREGSRHWEIALQLVHYLIQKRWIKTILYADLNVADTGKCETHPVPKGKNMITN